MSKPSASKSMASGRFGCRARSGTKSVVLGTARAVLNEGQRLHAAPFANLPQRNHRIVAQRAVEPRYVGQCVNRERRMKIAESLDDNAPEEIFTPARLANEHRLHARISGE